MGKVTKATLNREAVKHGRLRADHPGEMQGRRTFLIAAVVALVASAASVGIAALHLRADERRARYEALIELEASANRIDALEWEANARAPRAAARPGRGRPTLLVDMQRRARRLAARRRRGRGPRPRSASTATGR